MQYVAVGQDIHFKVSAYPGRTFAAKIERIGLEAEPKDKVIYYSATAVIDNPDQSLRAGMSGRGKLLAGEWRPLDQLMEQPLHWFKMTWVW